MQGTSLTKQERECKLYDTFDKFTHIKEESLHKYYLRFTQLINDMNIYKMKMDQFQVNTKFLNSLPPEWSKFVTDVKLVKDLHTTNFDQLHAYLEQHELHANERNQDTLALAKEEKGCYMVHGKSFIGRSSRKCKVLNEEELEFFVDPSIAEAKVVLMANLSSYGSDVLSEVPISDNTNNDMLNQSVQEMPYYEPSHFVEHQENEIHKIALENKVKELDNIVCKMGQSTQTVHMLIKPQVFYDNNLKQALGFQNPFYLKKAQQIRLMLYDGNVIVKETSVISIADSEETLMLEEESRSKMLLKQNFGKHFVTQRELSDEQALHPITDQSASSPFKIKAPRELPKMETAVQQYHVDKQCFEIQKKQFLIENDRLLDQIISQDIVNIIVNSSVEVNTFVNVNSSVVMNDSMNYIEMCNKCLELKAELIKQHNMVEKDEYNRLSKRFSELEQQCISLEIAMQLNKEIFQKNSTSVNQTEPSFNQLFELNNLKVELQAKDITIEKLKTNIKHLNKTSTTNSVKMNNDEIETINIELEHKVAKLIAENEHLKQTYKQLYDSIKLSRVHAKQHAESLVNQLNQKSVEITDLNAQLQEKVVVISALKNDLKKLKGKEIADNAAQMSNASTMYKLDPVILASKVKNNREAHEYYLKHTMEQAAILRKLIQELLGYVRETYPDIHKPRNIPKVPYRPLLSSTGVNPSTSASGSKPSGNTKNDRILRTPSSNEKNKVEVKSRKVKSSLNKRKSYSKNFCNVKHPVKEWNPIHIKDPILQLLLLLLLLFTAGCPNYSMIRNVTILRVYYVEGLGHNLFSVGQLCDSDLEVAFRKHTCFVRDLEGVDLLSGSRGTNMYSLSIGDMMASSPICLLSKSTKSNSWLWHRRLSNLNFGAINHLARHGLVRGLPRLKFEKDNLCFACAMGKSKKQSHKPKFEDTNQEKLYLLHMDLCGPMRVASVNRKKYILVIVDDYSRFT
ncbi:retrovirus-related pol polyprotein from transposon TNT 1-94 [Tanacetum coccineum]